MLYTLVSADPIPITLDVVKKYMKLTTDKDDQVITDIIEVAVVWGEKYTGKSFRPHTWNLLLDEFADRMELRKSLVDAITSVKYLVDASLSTVSSAVYYLKQGHQFSEVLLAYDQTWPTDADIIEHAVEIIFTTEAYRNPEVIDVGLRKHITHLYENRGDNDIGSAAKLSGATFIYDQFTTPRI